MSGRLSTHVLDLVRGVPAQGLPVMLERVPPSGALITLRRVVLEFSGRAVLLDTGLELGAYQLTFEAGAYRRREAAPGVPASNFLEQIVVRIGIDDASAHYHVPLLLSPFGYSVYRGS